MPVYMNSGKIVADRTGGESKVLQEVLADLKSGEGEKNALILLLDDNDDRSIYIPPKKDNLIKPSRTRLNYDSKYEKRQIETVKININTFRDDICHYRHCR